MCLWTCLKVVSCGHRVTRVVLLFRVCILEPHYSEPFIWKWFCNLFMSGHHIYGLGGFVFLCPRDHCPLRRILWLGTSLIQTIVRINEGSSQWEVFRSLTIPCIERLFDVPNIPGMWLKWSYLDQEKNSSWHLSIFKPCKTVLPKSIYVAEMLMYHRWWFLWELTESESDLILWPTLHAVRVWLHAIKQIDQLDYSVDFVHPCDMHGSGDKF